MADKNGKSSEYAAAGVAGGVSLGGLLTALLVVGGVGITAYGAKKLYDYLTGQNEFKKEVLEEYMLELEDLEEFQREVANKGIVPSTQDNLLIDQKVRAMETKEYVIKQEGFLESLRNLIFDTFAIAIPTSVGVGLVGYALYRWWKQRPPQPPQWKDPKTGQQFGSEEALNDHLQQTYLSQWDPVKIAQAETAFRSLPAHAQASIVSYASAGAHSNYFALETTSWTSQPGINWVWVAAGCAAVAALTGIAGPAGAAALLLV